MSDSKIILSPYQIRLISRSLFFYIEQFNHFLVESGIYEFDNQPFCINSYEELYEYFSYIDDLNNKTNCGEYFLEVRKSYLSHLD